MAGHGRGSLIVSDTHQDDDDATAQSNGSPDTSGGPSGARDGVDTSGVPKSKYVFTHDASLGDATTTARKPAVKKPATAKPVGQIPVAGKSAAEKIAEAAAAKSKASVADRLHGVDTDNDIDRGTVDRSNAAVDDTAVNDTDGVPTGNPYVQVKPEVAAAREAAKQVARDAAAQASASKASATAAPATKPAETQESAASAVYVTREEAPEIDEAPSQQAPQQYVQTGDGAPRIVYVEAPAKPKVKSNRGVGILIAVAAAVVYAIVYTIIVVAIFYLQYGKSFSLENSSILAPVFVFLVGFVLLILVAHRASWWAYIVGSVAVGVFTYFGSVGFIMLLTGGLAMSGVEAAASFGRGLADPAVIVAALLAREFAMWTGFIISARARRIKVKNLEAQTEYDRKVAETRNRYERTSAPTAS